MVSLRQTPSTSCQSLGPVPVAPGKSPGGQQSRGPAASGVRGPSFSWGTVGFPLLGLSYPIRAAAESYTLGRLNKRLVSDSSGDRKSELKVPARSGLVRACSGSHCVLMW